MAKIKNKSVNLNYMFIVPVIIICVLFTSCGRENKSILSIRKFRENIVSNIDQDKFDATDNIRTENNTISTTIPTEMNKEFNKEKVVSSWEEYDSTKFPLIASIPENDIYLYGLKSQGVILYINGEGYYYDWWYLTPRFILPNIATYDYDDDGKNELAVGLYIGSGTGCSVTDLHIIEISEDKILSNDPSSKDYYLPNLNYFKDNLFISTDYIVQLEKNITFDIVEEDNEITGNIMVGDKSYRVDLSQYYTDESGKIIQKLILGNIVYFDFSDNQIKGKFGVGIVCENFPSPYFIGYISADVKYENGFFKLDNYVFMKDVE